MADIPVNEYRLLEIERLLALVPTPQTISELLAFGANVHLAIEAIATMKLDIAHITKEANDLATAFDNFHIEYLHRQGQLTREIDRYTLDRAMSSEPYWLEYWGFREEGSDGG